MQRPAKFILCFLPLISLSAEAQPTRPPAALLRIHATFATGGHGLVYHDQDFFLSRDRQATAVVTRNAAAQPFSYWATTRADTLAPSAAFQALGQALTLNRVGAQQGSCSVNNTVGPDTGTFEASWYGQRSRSSVFRIRYNDPSEPTCNLEVVQLYLAIQALAHAIGVPLGAPLQSP